VRIRLLQIVLMVGMLASLVTEAGATSYLDNAEHLRATGQLRAAEIELKNALITDQQNMTAHYRLAVVQLQLGEAAAAEHEASVARAGGYDPDKVVPIIVDAYLMQGKYQQLLEEFPGTAGSATQRASVLVARGYAQLALQQPDQAKAAFEQAQQLAPKAVQPLLAEAKLAMTQHQLPAAETLFDRALSLAPQSKEALAGKAEVLRLKGDSEQAITLLDKAIAQAPDFIQARLERAQILLSQGHDAQAEVDIDAVMAAQPNNGAAVYLAAMAALKRKDFQTANADLQKISGMIAEIPHGYYVLALVQLNLHQLDQAADSARRYVARNPDDLAGHKLLGLIELGLGHPDETVDALSKFDSAGKADAGTLDLLGRAYAELGTTSKALSAFNEAVQLAPNNAALRMRLGAAQLGAGDTVDAVKDLQESLDISPTAPAGEMLVLTDLAAGQWPEATAAAVKLQKAQPDSPIPGNLLGLVKLAQFDLAGAETQFTNLSQKYPKYLPAQLNLSQVLGLEGKSDEAEDILTKMLAQEPTNGVALTRLVDLLLRDGKSAEAINAAEQAHNAAPTNAGITTGLIDLYLRVGQNDKALALARQESGENTVANFGLIAARARAEFASGHKTEALQTYQRLLAIAPARADLRVQYAVALAEAGDKDGARQAITEALKLAPNNPQLAASDLAIEEKLGGADAALKAAAQLKNDEPGLPTAPALEGDAYMAAGKYDLAADAYAKAFKGTPSTILALRLARAKAAGGNLDAAASVLQDWAVKNPDQMVVAEVLASYDISTHRYDEAEKEFQEVLEKTPQNVIALNNLAWLYQRAGDPRGRSLAERAYLLSPNLSQTADTLGWILVQQGHAADAVGLLQRASAAQKSDSTVQYHLAVALNDTGHPKEAIGLLTPLLQGPTKFDDKPAAEKLFAELSKK
jgi:cellulose synthase operon protein C